jgi:hypothetical protein
MISSDNEEALKQGREPFRDSTLFPIALVADPAAARNWKEALRDRNAHCSFLIIHDPDTRLLLDHMSDCCLFSQPIDNCQPLDRSSFERW